MKWLKPSDKRYKWDDTDRQVLIEGLGPEAFLMGGLPLDRADALGVPNEFPAEYLGETTNIPKKQSKLGKYVLLGLGLTAAAGIAYVALDKLFKPSSGKQVTSQLEITSPESQYQSKEQPVYSEQDKGIIGGAVESLEELQAKKEIERVAYEFVDAVNRKDNKTLDEIICPSPLLGGKEAFIKSATYLTDVKVHSLKYERYMSADKTINEIYGIFQVEASKEGKTLISREIEIFFDRNRNKYCISPIK